MRYDLPLFDDKALEVLYFEDVTNAEEICATVRQPGKEFAAIDARMICDPFQLVAAAHQALHAEEREKMATHAISSELIYATSGAKQINEAFRRFGATPASKRVVLTTFDSRVIPELRQLVKGKEADVNLLAGACDEIAIRKAYKINDAELKSSSLIDSVVTRIAIMRV
mmetsp:Transcript_14127/g.38055  ORF Transcript_14127/g.38055 Transcript_14127/m.38055 type:complete len:169 (-) Transcript_14127:35-541(-)